MAEEAGLEFLTVRRAAYDICYDASAEREPRVAALRRVLRSDTYRRWLSELPGYAVRGIGESA